jgi:hypothetical protein
MPNSGFVRVENEHGDQFDLHTEALAVHPDVTVVDDEPRTRAVPAKPRTTKAGKPASKTSRTAASAASTTEG